MSYFTVEQIAKANRDAGYHWFDRDTLRFFKSRVSGPVIAGMFVSSERRWDDARYYTIRRANPDGSIDTVGEFQQYRSKRAALSAIRRIAREG